MRLIGVLSLFALTLTIVILLNKRIDSYPPFGKFLDPVNGFWANSEKGAIQAPQAITINALHSPVKVYWDEALIPHIVAANNHDLYLTQGYVTAFHRLWQMEFQLFKTEGRLSEVIGRVTAEYDRWQRRKGLRYAAETDCAEASKVPEVNTMLTAYAEGVNAYIASLSYSKYPIEYKLLDYAPEPWLPYKSCLLIKEMGDILSLDDRDLEHTHLLQQLGKETFDLLFPERHPDLSYVVPAGTRFDFTPAPAPPPSKDTLQLFLPKQESGLPSSHGSNSVVISPAKSATGEVLFSNEPDLDLNLPSLWYLIHLVGPDGQVMGGSIPGLPGILVGFNDSIAWGITNAERDLSDWYQIKFVDDSRQEYYYNNNRYKTKTRIEAIHIWGEKTYYDTVIYTHHGPVVYGRNFSKDLPKGIHLARHWSGYHPQNEMMGLYLLNRAKNYKTFTRAVSKIKTPALNVSFGSTSGDIAIRIQGRFPLKWTGQGRFVMDGSKRANDWQGDVPEAHAPYVKNPKQGYVSSANQHPTDETYPYYLYSYNFEHFRGRRINERLSHMDQVRIGDLIKLQYDNFNYMAYEILSLMLDSLDRNQLSVEESAAYDLLARWDYFSEADALAPSYFESWMDTLKVTIWDELVAMSSPKTLPSTYNTTYLMRTHPQLPFYDKVNTPQIETLGDVISESFKKGVQAIQTWKATNNKPPMWSSVRNTVIKHLLRIEHFGVSGLVIGGGNHIVNAVEKDHGPSLRLVVSLGETGVKGWAIYPGGQPGHPGHPAYTAFMQRWIKADYLPLLFSKEKALLQERAIFVQDLQSHAVNR